MNINYVDGQTREQRMLIIDKLNKVLKTNAKTVDGNIKIIDSASSVDVRTPYATTATSNITGQLNTTITTNIATIKSDTNTQSNLDRTDIVAIMNDYADGEYTVITSKVTADRTAILATVDVEIAALTSAGTPPTAGKQDEMKRVALGYPAAADAASAEVLYYDDNVKSLLGYPNAASVAAAKTSYTIKRKNTGLGFPFLVNILGGHNLPRATAVVATNAIDSITVAYGGIGYTSQPDVVIIGGGGSGAICTAKLAYRIISATIVTPGSGYSSLRPVKIGGDGSGAQILVELHNGKLYRATIIHGGGGYTTIPPISIINGNKSLGTGGTVSVTLGNGYIETVTIDNGGTGFTSIPSVVFTNNSFEGKIEGTLDANGKITNLQVTNAGSFYRSAPSLTFHPNGTGSGASGSVTIKNASLDTVKLITPGTAYNSNEITVSNTESLYNDFQLKLAFGYGSALTATEAETKYTAQAYRDGYGFPTAKDMAAAAVDYFNMQLAAQLVDPDLITLTQAQQDQIYKDNFGYSSANSVNDARGLYRSSSLKSLLNGIEIAKPSADPVKRISMSVGASDNKHKNPIPKRKEDQVKELTRKNKTMELIFSGEKPPTKTLDKYDKLIAKMVDEEVSNIYNSNSFYQRDLVVAAQYKTESDQATTDVTNARNALVAATTSTATSASNTLYSSYETAGNVAGAAIVSYNTPLINTDLAAATANIDNDVDSIVANRNLYAQQIILKEVVITNAADEIKSTVEVEIALYGTANPPSQGIQDQMYKDAYGYPAAGSVAIARQSYIDNNLIIELGFPDDTLTDAKTKYIDLGVKTQLGYPTIGNISGAAVLAKVNRKKKALGQPDARTVNSAETLFVSIAMCKALGYPNEVTKITVTNKGKGYKTPPQVVFECTTPADTNFIKPEAYSVLNSFNEVEEIVITYNGYHITPTPIITLAGGGGELATAVVANSIPTNSTQAQTFYTSQHINTQFGSPDDDVDVTGTKQKYIDNEIMKDLGYNGIDDLETAKTLYFKKEFQETLGYINANPDTAMRYIISTEKNTKINDEPTDFLKRYKVAKFPNITDNNAAELLWYYNKMIYYLTNALPAKTLEYMNQLYKGDFGFPAKAFALATLTGGNIIDTITVTNPLENSGYAQSIPPLIYIDNVLTTVTVTVTDGRLTDISVTSSVVYASEPTITILRSFDLIDSAGLPASDSVVYGGSGYRATPTIVLKGGSGSGAIFATTIKDGKLIKVNVMMGGNYTVLPEAEVTAATGDDGKGAKINIILNAQGKIETYITVLSAQDGYTIKRTGEISSSRYHLSAKSIAVATQRGMNLVASDMTHDERVYGRKSLPTNTTRNAMILKSSFVPDLKNNPKSASMALSNSRPLMTREKRISQANSYTALYRQAELYVKFKIVEGANADPVVTYTEQEKHDMLYARLALIKK